ncbi:response regulator transcription factor [Kaarinaea lacus]
MRSDAIVYIIDDDEGIRHSLELLLQSVGKQTKTCTSAQEFLNSYDATKPGCLVLDVRMPGMSGLDLQHLLNEQEIQIPTIIITGHGDVPLAVRAMKEGAVDVIEKPFNDQTLLDSLAKAEAKSIEIHETQSTRTRFQENAKQLSPRELEVMNLLIMGKTSKAIAGELNISSKTVDVHRGHIMEKMNVKSVVELARLALNNSK